MKRTTKYVALDVHHATTLASVREEGGRVIARTILPAEEPAIGRSGASLISWEDRYPQGRQPQRKELRESVTHHLSTKCHLSPGPFTFRRSRHAQKVRPALNSTSRSVW